MLVCRHRLMILIHTLGLWKSTLANQSIISRVLLGLVAMIHGSSVYGEDHVRFATDVQPILSNHCYTCHGPDENTRESGLRLDQRSSALATAESGQTPIVPGDLQRSEVYQRITSDDDELRMPPSDPNHRLTSQEVNTLAQWIMEGAEYELHWAFKAPQKPEMPTVSESDWVQNPIDLFILKELQRLGRTPAIVANREALIRRVSFDLTGLPPTLDEIDTYLGDDRPNAYERMVDRYLHSPHYGEHLGRYWLDLARYADSNGYQYDTEREQWAWRDWVIHAYNSNLPFDEFTIQQIAGDLLPDSTGLERLATGFNRNHGITIEGGIIDEEYRTEYVMDRVVTTASVWLGMTIGCARCHDHKYDPISQKEFYELFALFNQVPERGMRGFAPQEKIPSPLENPEVISLKRELQILQRELTEPIDLTKQISKWAASLRRNRPLSWEIAAPAQLASSGGSTLTKLDDQSILISGKNPQQDIYTITAETASTNLRAIRLEALTHPSLPGGGPGRHSNSNFVLSEFELEAISILNPNNSRKIKFKSVVADYSQQGYEIGKTIDGQVSNNSGWAVDGPTRKKSATAIWVANEPFGYEGGTQLKFTLKHQANFATHGIGRPRLSITSDMRTRYEFTNIPKSILAKIEKPFEELAEKEQQELTAYFLEKHDPRADLRRRIENLQNKLNQLIPTTMVMAELSQPRTTHILERGQYDQPGAPVTAGVPECCSASTKMEIKNRLDFATWLTEPNHPLTARVAVNRHWRRLFGRGLVETAEDFGIQGDLPSHPELLDWLATDLISNGWDIKYLQRQIITSATYRQSSIVERESYELDPDNQWLSRGPRFRLDGEQIRDSALSASGLLHTQLGGKSVFPYQPEGLWLELNNRPGYSKAYPQGTGEDLVRRSIYSFWKRTVPSPMLKTLDAPEREFCTIRRSRTNTPLQALLLLNGTQFMEASIFLGSRMMLEGEGDITQRIAFGFRLVTSRFPSEEELKILRQEYNASLQQTVDVKEDDPSLGLVIGKLRDLQLNPTQLRAYANVARIILNLDESITKS